jgi:hypothetical protein
MGSERGELASSQDKLNWDERILDRRTQFAGPFVVRPFIDRLIEFGALPQPTEYVIRWPENQNLDAGQRMDLAVKATTANKNQGATVITEDEIRTRILLYPPLEDVDPDAAARNEENAEADLELKTQPVPDEGEDEEDEEDAELEAAAGRRAANSGAIERAANRYRARFASGFIQTFARIQAQISLNELERALYTRDRDTVTNLILVPLLSAQGDLTRAFARSLMDTLEAGGNAAARNLRRQFRTNLRTAKDAVGLVFDRTNPAAIEWVNFHGAELVTQVTSETRQAIRTALDRAFVEGISTRDTARMLRDTIGLTDVQSDAVLTLRERLLESPGRLVRAGRTPIRVPKTGASQQLLDKATRQYADRLLQKRAQTIARHETMTASNEGQRQLWRQAQTTGDLPRHVRVGVILSTNACAICSAMDGETRDIDSTYSGGLPPFHIRCTCTEGITSL